MKWLENIKYEGKYRIKEIEGSYIVEVYSEEAIMVGDGGYWPFIEVLRNNWLRCNKYGKAQQGSFGGSDYLPPFDCYDHAERAVNAFLESDESQPP